MLLELPSAVQAESNSPRMSGRQRARPISLPPVAGPDRRKMDDVLMFSRNGKYSPSREKLTYCRVPARWGL